MHESMTWQPVETMVTWGLEESYKHVAGASYEHAPVRRNPPACNMARVAFFAGMQKPETSCPR